MLVTYLLMELSCDFSSQVLYGSLDASVRALDCIFHCLGPPDMHLHIDRTIVLRHAELCVQRTYEALQLVRLMS